MNYYKIFKAFKIKDEDAIFFTMQLEKEFENYNITNKDNICFFLANVLHESNYLTRFKENMYYTTEIRLIQVFPSAFKTGKYKAINYIKNPEKLANLVYDDRLFPKGLGNKNDGDGFKFLGRGAIQITGRNNYSKLSEVMCFDYINNSKLLENREHALKSAIGFWIYSNAKNSKTLLESRKIVVGKSAFGYKEVELIYKKIKDLV